MTTTTFALLATVFLVLVAGFTLAKCGVVDAKLNTGLSTLLLRGVLPIAIVGSAASPYSPAVAKGFFIVFGFALVYYLVAPLIFYAIGKRVSVPDKADGLFSSMTVFGNVGFIGIPLASQLYGSTGLIFAVSLNIAWNLSMFSLMRIILSGERHFSLKNVFTDINMIATYIMMVFYFLQPYWAWQELAVSQIIMDACNKVGAMLTPLSLFIIGYAIASMSVKEVITEKWAYVVSVMRLLVVPLAFIALFAVLPLPPTVERVTVFLLAMPCATLNVIFANMFRLNVKFCSKTVTASYVLMIATLPIILTVSGAVLGTN
ncbi:AEC family transporter [Nanchangia anserum]|uniref:AEC family transporter n=1 Tax=Nanchangia anserum TaxID=2692125 RepID=A0A8I0G905_9ACTO|nr:AEC family transporter [Nanchangia anserum]MBD3689369.1 AEC family transporter [Nanchangia anserum]QOX81576.1 AEC family transporter [Nanchangia anserum]